MLDIWKNLHNSSSSSSLILQESGSMDLDVTSPKQLNRRVFLKQLAVDLCGSERRILFRTQYVRTHLAYISRVLIFSLSFYCTTQFSPSDYGHCEFKPDTQEKIKRHKKRRTESSQNLRWLQEAVQMRALKFRLQNPNPLQFQKNHVVWESEFWIENVFRRRWIMPLKLLWELNKMTSPLLSLSLSLCYQVDYVWRW